jgi:hypothetical protein
MITVIASCSELSGAAAPAQLSTSQVHDEDQIPCSGTNRCAGEGAGCVVPGTGIEPVRPFRDPGF